MTRDPALLRDGVPEPRLLALDGTLSMSAARGVKNVPLEALRGFAAIAVLAWHFMLGFWPHRSGIFAEFDPSVAIDGRPWFGLIYGPAAVTFFFVLSAYVLTGRALSAGDVVALARGSIKRWPRLVGPVLISVLGSFLLFRMGAYGYVAAGEVTRSPWLMDFAYALGGQPFDPGLSDALWHGAWVVFVRSDVQYVSSLWTMHYELVGSLIAYVVAIGLVCLRQVFLFVRVVFVGSILVYMACFDHWYVAFVAGVALAAVLSEARPSLPLPVAAVFAIGALYLAGYSDGRGAYRWIADVVGPIPGPCVHALAAVALIFAVERCASLHSVLSHPWATAIGRLSFPIYLTHIPMLCSVGCAVFLVLHGVLPPPWPEIVACLATVVATLAVSVPLATFDAWWIRKVNASLPLIVHDAASMRERLRRRIVGDSTSIAAK
jgi:peptidoglycan/LPS O-acetylase OafA/YrhL